MTRSSQIAAPLIATGIVLLLWHAAVVASGVAPAILPSPGAVARSIARDAIYLAQETAVTAIEAGGGLLLGGLAALGVGVGFARYSILRDAGYPYVIAFKAVPLVVLAPLTELWFPGTPSKIVLSAVIAFFPVLVALVDGMERAPKAGLGLMATLSATSWQTIYFFQLPHAMPSVFSGLKVSSTFAVIGAVVAEFVASDRGIGHVIAATHYYLQTAQTFAAIVAAALLGIAFFAAVHVLERLAVPWAKRGEGSLA